MALSIPALEALETVLSVIISSYDMIVYIIYEERNGEHLFDVICALVSSVLALAAMRGSEDVKKMNDQVRISNVLVFSHERRIVSFDESFFIYVRFCLDTACYYICKPGKIGKETRR